MTRNQAFPLDAGWRLILKDLGVQPARVLRRAGLPEDLLSRPGQSLATPDYLRFWQSLEDEAADPLFALRIVESITAESFDPPIFAALCSANLMQAVQRLAKYKQLVAPMSLEIAVAGNGDLSLTPRWLQAPSGVPGSLQAAEIALFVRLVRLATREPVNAIDATLPVLPAAALARPYENFFGVPVRQGPNPSVSFAAANALRPFLTLNEGMWRVFEPDLRRRLSELDATATTAERVRALLLELLPSNAASIEGVAARLGMSKRTLQRRLEEEGAPFRALVNGTRESLARHYLENTALSGGEIAFLLGFEDPNSFYRAFLDWTGQTPERLRHAQRLN
ncbi:AraC family transcriptional regulator [Pseudomonas chlororaphis]|uniref:AraC family transcriptional regulator n=1 Tax=Pseudomonas chlororaphis TaxID=587753 RepID=UPI001E520E3E|nr:AraC family transcriptional regulator [Pseudomonas chlororaphis]MCB2252243.1 AraC family transcriptional regulator [Pseudomonas chlororaphis]